ncbi:MAG: Gfo/Idh/MocA family oxidoreductase [Limisphaerales bacterium]
MNPKTSLTRRSFLQSGALVAAPFLLPASVWKARGAASPNRRLRFGYIGSGKQANHLLNSFLPHPDVQVVAVCDVDTTRREHYSKKVEEFYSAKQDKAFKGCDAMEDYRELVGREDIDAVVISTPDHWHAAQAILAAERGKDIYCEKPLSLTIAEARAMVKATRANERVFQTGSMQRSDGAFYRACTLVRNGVIGEVKEVYVSIGGPSDWCDLPEEPMEPGLDWNMWLGPAPVRPYNSVLSPRGVHDHFPNWRSYREYSGGGMTDWGAHHFDIAQWGLGMDDSGPVEIIPPGVQGVDKLTYRYANGVVMVRGGLEGYDYGVVFVGTKGKIAVDRGRFKADPEKLGEVDLDALPVKLYRSRNHYRDFVESIHARKKPICDVEVGARSVTVCHLGNLAYWNKRALRWDPQAERFIGDAEANTWLDREKRDPWKA